MKKDLVKKLMEENVMLRIPLSLSKFEELAKQIIKEDTGVDVSKALSCDYDSETYAIYTQLDEDKLTEEEVEKLEPFNIDEDYLNSTYILSSLFGINYGDISIYTSETEVEASVENDNDYICYIYVPYKYISILTQKFTVKAGDVQLTVTKDDNEEYPGVNVHANDSLIARVEKSKEYGLRTIAYNKDSDDPVSITKWDDKKYSLGSNAVNTVNYLILRAPIRNDFRHDNDDVVFNELVNFLQTIEENQCSENDISLLKDCIKQELFEGAYLDEKDYLDKLNDFLDLYGYKDGVYYNIISTMVKEQNQE